MARPRPRSTNPVSRVALTPTSKTARVRNCPVGLLRRLSPDRGSEKLTAFIAIATAFINSGIAVQIVYYNVDEHVELFKGVRLRRHEGAEPQHSGLHCRQGLLAPRSPEADRALQGVRLRRHGGAEPKTLAVTAVKHPLPFAHQHAGRALQEGSTTEAWRRRTTTIWPSLPSRTPCPFRSPGSR